jgi:hypothetical protein
VASKEAMGRLKAGLVDMTSFQINVTVEGLLCFYYSL